MSEWHDELLDYELEVSALEDYEDKDIAYMTKRIEAIYKAVISKGNSLESDGLLLKVTFHSLPDSKNNLLCPEVQIESSPLVYDYKVVTLDEYASPANCWLCVRCRTVNIDTESQCGKCGTFRLIESFPNAIGNPTSVTQQEIALLKQRREREKHLICGRDLLTSEVIPMDECLYLISAEWLMQWKAFIFNKPYKNTRVSPNPSVGVLPPGPISNHFFFLKDKKTLKPELKQVTCAAQ